MAPPQTNATITRVAGAGTADDWDRPGQAGAEKWAGRERAYFRRQGDRIADGQAVNVLERDELIVGVAWVRAVGLDTDDTVTYLVDGDEEAVTATPQAIPIKTLAGIPASLQTARIALEAR